MKYTKQTIYRDENGKFISTQKYNNYQKRLQKKQENKVKENLECAKITFKIMVVMIIVVATFSILNH